MIVTIELWKLKQIKSQLNRIIRTKLQNSTEKKIKRLMRSSMDLLLDK